MDISSATCLLGASALGPDLVAPAAQAPETSAFNQAFAHATSMVESPTGNALRRETPAVDDEQLDDSSEEPNEAVPASLAPAAIHLRTALSLLNIEPNWENEDCSEQNGVQQAYSNAINILDSEVVSEGSGVPTGHVLLHDAGAVHQADVQEAAMPGSEDCHELALTTDGVHALPGELKITVPTPHQGTQPTTAPDQQRTKKSESMAIQLSGALPNTDTAQQQQSAASNQLSSEAPLDPESPSSTYAADTAFEVRLSRARQQHTDSGSTEPLVPASTMPDRIASPPEATDGGTQQDPQWDTADAFSADSPEHQSSTALEAISQESQLSQDIRLSSLDGGAYTPPSSHPASDKPLNSDLQPAPPLSSVRWETAELDRLQPLRRVLVNVDGAEGQVRVRITGNGGELRASVAGNTNVVIEKVQAELNDLFRALTATGLDAEIQIPQRHNVVGAPVAGQLRSSAPDVQAFTTQPEQTFDDGGSRHGSNGEEQRREPPEPKQDDVDGITVRSHIRSYQWRSQ